MKLHKGGLILTMCRKTWFFNGLFSLILLTSAYADLSIEISGQLIPVPEPAVNLGTDAALAANARVQTYSTDKTVDETISFYEAFLKENGFIFIGGEDNGSFNASIKKGDCMFTLRIYVSGRKTLIEFIW